MKRLADITAVLLLAAWFGFAQRPGLAAAAEDTAGTESEPPTKDETAESAAAAEDAAPPTTAAAATPKAPLKDTAMTQIEAMIASAKVDKSKADWRTSVPKPEAATFDPKHSYFATMKTNKGDLTIKLLPDVAPMHVTSFIYLTKLGFYDGLSFHRVIPGFMAQGGCPLGTGTGDPGYKYDSEFKPTVKHDRPGLLSMANAGPGTDGSQFFLTFKATPWLDGKHTIYGEIVEGMETLKKLETAGSPGGATSEPLKMEKVSISVK